MSYVHAWFTFVTCKSPVITFSRELKEIMTHKINNQNKYTTALSRLSVEASQALYSEQSRRLLGYNRNGAEDP